MKHSRLTIPGRSKFTLQQQTCAEAGGVQEGRGCGALKAAALAEAHAAQPLLARALAQVIAFLRSKLLPTEPCTMYALPFMSCPERVCLWDYCAPNSKLHSHIKSVLGCLYLLLLSRHVHAR